MAERRGGIVDVGDRAAVALEADAGQALSAGSRSSNAVMAPSDRSER
jgi:hypothetical protein